MKQLIQNILLITLTLVPALYGKDPGLEAFHEEEYDKALNYYMKKLEKDQSNPVLNYNAGTAAMKLKRPDLAIPHFEKSLRNANDKQILSKNSYNLGHLLAENNEYEQALNAFMQAILLNPEDVNSKIMYEMIKSRMQEQEEQNQAQDQKQEQGQDQEQEGDQKQEKEHDEEQEGNQEQTSDSESRDNQVSEDTSTESRDPEQDLTEQQIVNLLDAMRDKEKEAMKEILRHRFQDYKIQREKDW